MYDECFMCTNEQNCSVVDNRIVSQVEYLLPEIKIIKLGIPLHICSSCEKSLQSFSKFKQASLENSLRLEAKIKASQCSTQALDSPDTEELILPLEVQITVKAESIDSKKEIPENTTDSEDSDETLKKEIKDTRNFQCSICNKSFTRNYDLKEHMNIHSETMNYECRICKKLFTLSRGLKKHMKTHTKIMEFQCPTCNKLFLRKDQLIRHQDSHTGKRDFQCSICNRMFSRKEHLLAHEKTHTGVKDFKCNICNKLFIRKSQLNSHLKTHSGIKDFQCTICNKMFTYKSNLTTHLKIHADVQ